jgi:hypothetical protein
MKGAIALVLGLEVLETLKAYFRDHHVRLEVILVVRLSQPVVIWSSSTSNMPLFWGRLGFPL